MKKIIMETENPQISGDGAPRGFKAVDVIGDDCG